MTENFKVEPRSRTYEGLSPLTKEISTLTKKVLGERGFTGIELITHWSEILGPDLAQGVLPVRLSFPKGKKQDGTLHVRTAAGAFALLFEQQKTRVCEHINSYFGYPAISQIKMVQGGIKLPEPEEPETEWPLGDEEVQDLLKKVDTIEDDALRQKTFEIGVSLLQRKAQS